MAAVTIRSIRTANCRSAERNEALGYPHGEAAIRRAKRSGWRHWAAH